MRLRSFCAPFALDWLAVGFFFSQRLPVTLRFITDYVTPFAFPVTLPRLHIYVHRYGSTAHVLPPAISACNAATYARPTTLAWLRLHAAFLFCVRLPSVHRFVEPTCVLHLPRFYLRLLPFTLPLLFDYAQHTLPYLTRITSARLILLHVTLRCYVTVLLTDTGDFAVTLLYVATTTARYGLHICFAALPYTTCARCRFTLTLLRLFSTSTAFWSTAFGVGSRYRTCYTTARCLFTAITFTFRGLNYVLDVYTLCLPVVA